MNVPIESKRRGWGAPKRRSLLPFLVLAVVCAAFFTLTFKTPVQKDDPAAQPVAQIATVPAPEIAEPQPVVPDKWREGHFDGNKIFFYKLVDAGVQSDQIQTIIDTLTPVYDFRRSHPSHRWRVGFLKNRAVTFTLKVSPAKIFDITGLDGDVQLQQRPVETFTAREVITGEINGSLLQSLKGTPDSLQLALMLANQVFAWDIDFYKDPRVGDRYEILVEKNYIRDEEGPVFSGYGDILAARYLGDCGVYEAFRYEYEDERGYFNASGESLIRDFLRSPLKLQRVTSSFKRRRFHPVLKRYRAHNGIDYGAPRGTPVMAVADGRVKRAGRYGGAGIAVELNHRNKMMTQYFHLNKIAKGVRRGTKVKQGQVIGYVGKTGLASGYHLHFGMKIRGRYVDPMRQKFKPGKAIPKHHMDAFQAHAGNYLELLHTGEHTVPDAVVRVPPMLASGIARARL